METMTGVQYEKDTLGRARYAHIDLNGIMSNKSNRHIVSRAEEYTDAEILVYNSMINASKIIAKHI